jgi:RNA polymerase sigma-70 factor (ECF subfamily)
MGNLKTKATRQEIEKALVAIVQDDSSTTREKESAFNELYSNNQRQLLVYFLKNVRESETAEDLQMVTFEKVYANIKSYDSKYAFTTWMYKIALNCLIDHSRKAKFEQLSIDALSSKTSSNNDGMDFQIKSDSLNPEDIMQKDERISSVRDAIDSIENTLIRELMEHRFISDLSFEQIAEEMGIKNNSTLRVNILRGKEILKKQLSDINPYK